MVSTLQQLRVGDWVPMFSQVSDLTAFKVAAFSCPHYLVWAKPDSTWTWQLCARDGRTRLVTRLRILYRWHRPAEALLALVLNEFGDFPMMRKMLLNLKRLAETPATAAPADAG